MWFDVAVKLTVGCYLEFATDEQLAFGINLAADGQFNGIYFFKKASLAFHRLIQSCALQ